MNDPGPGFTLAMTAVQTPVNGIKFYCVGQVELAADVVVAAGAVLVADPGCRLKLAAGVCLGPSTIVHAQGGNLTLEAGVCLATGVCVVGQGWIGAGACLGADVTVINPAIAAHSTVAPKSLVGDRSRWNAATPNLANGASGNGSSNNGASNNGAFNNGSSSNGASDLPPVDSNLAASAQLGSAHSASANAETESSDAVSGGLASFNHVYGKQQMNQLLNTLFPHRQALNNAENNNGSSANGATSSETT